MERSESVLEASLETRQKENDDPIAIKGESVRHVRYGKNSRFEINARGFNRDAIEATVLSKCIKSTDIAC